MSNFWKILLLILISLSFTSPAQAADGDFVINLTVNNPDIQNIVQNYLTDNSIDSDQKINFVIPANQVAGFKALANASFRPEFLSFTGTSLEDYINKKNSRFLANNTDFKKSAEFVSGQVLSKLIHIPSKDAIWREENGRVVEFSPGTNGRSYDPLEILQAIAQIVAKNENTVTIEPEILVADNNLAEINPYGIKTLIGRGTSNFSGSPANRIHNVKLGAQKISGTIVAPGQVFSFNTLLGPVEDGFGWKPELVIKRNGLIPELGGGICQVSSTVFRAALNTGLPITERRNHSFSVRYYLPPGTDATIYPGVQDLKFTNDTKGHILLWPSIVGAVLTFDIYGVPDERQIVVDSPVRYGTQTSGAFSTSLKRTIVYASGEKKEDIFRSYYRPQEEFVQTTTSAEPATGTPPPQTTPPPATAPTPPTTDAPPIT